MLDREDDHEGGGKGPGRVDVGEEDRLAAFAAVEGEELSLGGVAFLAAEGDSASKLPWPTRAERQEAIALVEEAGSNAS